MPASSARRALLVVLALVLVVLAGCNGSESPDAAASATGSSSTAATGADLPACPAPGAVASGSKLLPDITLPCLGGGQLALRQLTGTPTVLNFWAAWCKPCQEEMPALADFAARANGAVRVIGVDTGESPKSGAAFLAENDIPYPSLNDEDSTVSHALGLAGIPGTVLLRADGSIAAVIPRQLDFANLQTLVSDSLGVQVHG
jgi:peroxiredoxin